GHCTVRLSIFTSLDDTRAKELLSQDVRPSTVEHPKLKLPIFFIRRSRTRVYRRMQARALFGLYNGKPMNWFEVAISFPIRLQLIPIKCGFIKSIYFFNFFGLRFITMRSIKYC